MQKQNDGLGWTTNDWKRVALLLQLAALILAGTLYAMVARAPAPGVSGIALWVAAGVGTALIPIVIGLFGLLNKSNKVIGFVVVSWIVIIIMFAFISKNPVVLDSADANKASLTQPIAPPIHGEWSCTDLFSKKTSRLILSTDGSVSVSTESGSLINDPWLRWYYPLQANANEPLVLLRIRPEGEDTLVVHNPRGNVTKCVR